MVKMKVSSRSGVPAFYIWIKKFQNIYFKYVVEQNETYGNSQMFYANVINPLLPSVPIMTRLAKIFISISEGIIKKISYERQWRVKRYVLSHIFESSHWTSFDTIKNIH